ncbi:transcription termination factor MTERF4, chloroplastic [Aristolochia californica]|uniref:transcription termination factor MTERF4, chloroplastic n=1 Tax=Aristolochia californica TaxID=171875 RepID=UPI0035DEB3BF
MLFCSSGHVLMPPINMKSFIYSGLMQPRQFFLLHELSTPTLRCTQFSALTQISCKKKNCITVQVCNSVQPNTYSSAASTKSSLTITADSDRKPGGPTSLYSRPSLHQMKNEKIANRSRINQFLRDLGIIPDELDGLELPVSIEVMRERVDFLHKLGLTIEDINNYPLVLGCSVKKNMIPVLDYLGKLGVRKASLAEFLRRYPQVLHASVVIDLQPVVKYLQGMDIKPNDIPRVLEKYPELLGFKLEGTMSTSVAYLVGIGVGRREIGGVLTRYPEILGMRVGRVIKPFVEHLESLGIPRLAVARLIEKRPLILGFNLDNQVKPNVNSLVEYNVRKEMLPSVIAQYPDIIGLELKHKLHSQRNFLESILELDVKDTGVLIEKMPQVVSLTQSSILKHVNFLKTSGFSPAQVKKMIIGCPQLLALNLDIMRLNFEYFQNEMHRDLDDLVNFPAFFTFGLESTIRPRHEIVAKKGLKCSLAWLLNCSDDRFEERMSYDSFDIQEMEVEPSFDMRTLTEPRSDETDSDGDYESYSDEDC